MPRRTRATMIALAPAAERVASEFIVEKRIPPRLHDVLRAAMQGFGIHATASELGVSVHTAKAYRYQLCELANMRPVPRLVALLLRRALDG